MFEELLPRQPDEEQIPYDLLVDRTEGYSGSDIRLLCKETAMQPLRRLMSQLEQEQNVVPEEGMLLTKSNLNICPWCVPACTRTLISVLS